jgi:hypothetical protein
VVDLINTDAEGRLILGDAMTYAEQIGATHIVDVATLTGAVGRRIGTSSPACSRRPTRGGSTSTAAAGRAGERYHRFPLIQDYMAEMESWYADFQNTGTADGSLVKSACSSSSSGPCRGPTSTSAAPRTSARRRRTRLAARPGSPTRRSSSSPWPGPRRPSCSRRSPSCSRSPGRPGASSPTGSRPLAGARRRLDPRDRLADAGRGRRRRPRARRLTLRFTEPVAAVVLGAYLVVLVLLLATDLDQRLLPDVFTLPMIPLAFLFSFSGLNPLVPQGLITATVDRDPRAAGLWCCRSRSGGRDRAGRPQAAGLRRDHRGPARLFYGVIYGALLAGIVWSCCCCSGGSPSTPSCRTGRS